MGYTVEIIPKDKQNTGTWSGGTTTELAIYPGNSEYKARNFKWRLSSACVDIEESTFTSLPGIDRHIMILEGEMELLHEGHHNVLLKPFEKDSFSGGWTTRSIGKARDFNLMLSEGCEGALDAIIVKTGMSVEAELGLVDAGFMNYTNAFYCSKGEIEISTDKGEAFHLRWGDLILLTCQDSGGSGKLQLKITGRTDAIVIRAQISY